MSPWDLLNRNILNAGGRSLAVFLCAAGLSFALGTTALVLRGNEHSLQAGVACLGADVVVMPAGTEGKVETALLTGKPVSVRMDEARLAQVAAVPGVAAVSPQLFLQSLYGASCCSVSEMFLVVFDPGTDFTLRPWLSGELRRELGTGEVIGGAISPPMQAGTSASTAMRRPWRAIWRPPARGWTRASS